MLSLRAYVSKKFGHHRTISGHLLYMFKNSFLSNSFKEFWQHWNPLWSYYLAYYIYRPLAKYTSKSIALILTFGVSGAFHDVFVMMLLGGFYYLFTRIFIAFALFIQIESKINISLSKVPLFIKPRYHIAVISGIVILFEHYFN